MNKVNVLGCVGILLIFSIGAIYVFSTGAQHDSRKEQERITENHIKETLLSLAKPYDHYIWISHNPQGAELLFIRNTIPYDIKGKMTQDGSFVFTITAERNTGYYEILP